MIQNLGKQNSAVSNIVAEIRNLEIQKDSMRFRHNLERLGSIFAYEISKELDYKKSDVETPFGTAECNILQDKVVAGTILRAGLPLHTGLIQIFDQAESAFISAYRKHDKTGEFTIRLEYVSCPEIENKILILSDPMLATGASMVMTLKKLLQFGKPKKIYIVSVIASVTGIEYIRKSFKGVSIWTGGIDDELTAKGYIVPGLGDAGDLAFGEKTQF